MTNNLKIPTLRFPEFEGEWEEKKLGEIATFFSGGTPTSSNKEYYNGEIPFIGSGDIDLRKMNKFITKEALNSSSAKMVEEGDILYALYGATSGKVAISKIDGAINQAVLCIRTDENKFFIKTWLDKSKGNILSTYLQGGQGNLSSQIIKSLTLNLPSLPEQEKIANFLSKVDERLEASKKEKKALEDYKKGVSQKIFNQIIRFKADDGSDFPEWEERKLGEVGETYNGLTGKTADDFGAGSSFITYKQIFDNSKININKFSLVNISDTDKQNKAKYGDIFFTISSETPNEIGLSSVLLEDVDNLYLNSFCFGFRPNSLKELYPEFSRFLFRSEIFRKEVIKLAQGSTRYNMSKIGFMKILISLPSPPEQEKIAEFLSNPDEKIEKSEAEIKKLEEFKKGLLQKMFV